MKNAIKMYATGLTIQDTQTMKDLTVIFTYQKIVALVKTLGQNHSLSSLSKSLFSSLDFGSLTAKLAQKIFKPKSKS